MSIRDALRLDHFYVMLSPADFAEFIPLANMFLGSRHKTVKTAEGSWEGIYLFSQSQSYFEIMADGEGVGLALSAEIVHYHNVSKIKEEMPWLKWDTGLIKFPDGQPWFEWNSTTPSAPSRSCLETWTMNYFSSHRENISNTFVRPTISKFKQLRVLVGEKRFDEIKVSSEWTPGNNFFGQDRCLLEIPARDGSVFVMDFQKVPGDKVEFVQLDFEVRPDVFIEPYSMTHFEIRQLGSTVSLTRVCTR